MTGTPTASAPAFAARLEALGPIAMIIGYGAVGASAFALLAAGPRLLGPEGYSSLALTWTVVTIIGIGVAAPGEQTITRAIAGGRDDGIVRAVGRRIAFLPVAAALLLPISVALGVEIQDAGLWTATLFVSAVSWIVMAGTRGVLAGRHRFGGYAATLLTEALSRIGIVTVALLFPSQGLLLLAGAVMVPLLASGACGWWMLRRTVDLRAEPFAEDSRREQGSITAVALLGQVCMSTSPLWLHWQSTDAALAGAFVSATSYMRIPLLLAGGLYGPILAQGAREFAAANRRGVVNRTVVGLGTGVGGSALASMVLFVASGPALAFLYGGDTGLSDAVIFWLGVATVGSVASNILTQVLYACERAPSAVLAWIPPAAATTLLFATAGGDVERMSLSMAVGQVLAAGALLALLPRALPAAIHERSGS